MGADTVFSATEAAEALTYMAMAGWKTSDMLGGIEGIMNLAAASGEDLAQTSDIVTDALTAFGLAASDAGHFADVLAVASSNSNTNVGMMGETFKYVAPMAGSLKYSIEDVSVAIGLMANSGIKASMAGTSLNAILTRLSTNTSGATETLSALGVEFFDAEGNARDLGKVLSELREKTADMSSEQKTALAYTIAGTEASKGFLSIINASTEDFDKLTAAIYNADGAAEQMANTMVDNLHGDLALAESALEDLQLAAYDCIEEPFRKAVQSATDMLEQLGDSANDGELREALERLGESAGELIDGAAELATDILPKLITLAAELVENIGDIATAFVAFEAGRIAVTKMGTAITSLQNSYKAAKTAVAVYTTAVESHAHAELYRQSALEKAIAAEKAALAALSAKEIVVGTLTGKITLATAAQELWNRAMAAAKANALGIAGVLTGVLVAAVVHFAKKAKEAEEERTKALTEAREEYDRVIESGKKATEEAEIQAIKIQSLKDRIYELDDALGKEQTSNEKSAEKKRELASAVDDLKELVPDLYVEIDEETGRLSTQRTEIDKLCETYGKLAVAKAKANAAEENLTAAYKAQFAAQDMLKEAQNEYADIGIPERPTPNAALTFEHLLPILQHPKQYYESTNAFNDASAALKAANEDVAYWENLLIDSKNAVSDLENELKGYSAGTEENENRVNLAEEDEEDEEDEKNGNKSKEKTPYEIESDELKHRRNMDLITEEEYYGELAGLRDTYLEEDSDEWRSVTEEIYQYRKKMDEDEQERREKEDKEAYEAERKAAFEELEYRKNLGVLTEREYYDELASLRDKYYDENSSEWRDYTSKLIDYEKSAIREAYEDIAAHGEKTIGAVEEKMRALSEKLSSYGERLTENDDGVKKIADPKQALNTLLEYNYYLGEVKRRMQEMNLSDEDISDFFSLMSDMSVEDGSEFARLLNEKSDKAFSDYIHDFKRQNELSDTISDLLYEDEMQRSVDDSVDYIDKRFEELALCLPDEFFAAGGSSAEAFGKAFTEELDSMLASMTSKIQSFYSSFGLPMSSLPTVQIGGGSGGTNTTCNNTATYNIATTGTPTPARIRATIEAQESLKRLGGIGTS